METWHCKKLKFDSNDKNDLVLIRGNYDNFVLKEPPRIPFSINELKMRRNISKDVFKRITFFVDVIKDNYPTFDLSAFYRNIKTLCVILFYNNDENFEKAGWYNMYDNEIHIVKNLLDSSFFHELFHLSTTYLIAEENLIYTGFC